MKLKHLFISLLIFSTLNTYAQIKFEKGYFIDIQGVKKECYIKNVDWDNNPSKLIYKLSKESEKRTIQSSKIKAFEIYDYSKFVREKVKVDTSGTEFSELSSRRNPEWKEEDILLEVLVEGKATLYRVSSKKLERYFFKTEKSGLQQLIYKKYKAEQLNIKTNNTFKQQLSSYVKCSNSSFQSIQNLEFYKNTLVKYFTKYNECSDTDFVDYEQMKNRDIFHLNIKPGTDYTSFTGNNNRFSISNLNFDGAFYWRLGLELEYKLPFRKNKWSIIAEPAFTILKSENGTYNVGSNDLEASIDYKSIELAVGVRHYFFLNDHTTIFVNGAAVMATHPGSSVTLANRDIEFDKRFNFSTLTLGVGFSYKKWSIEYRYHRPKNIFKFDDDWSTSLEKSSLILGYQIF